jgi:hypothetical protein
MKLHISPKIMAFLSIILCLTPAALFAQDTYAEIDYSVITVGTPKSGTLNQDISDPYGYDVTGQGHKVSVQAGKVYQITAKFTGEDASDADFYLLGSLNGDTDDLIGSGEDSYGGQEDTYTVKANYSSDVNDFIYILLYGNDENNLSYTVTVEEATSYKDIDYPNIAVGTSQSGTLNAKVMAQDEYNTSVFNAAGYTFNATANKIYKITVIYTQSEPSNMNVTFGILNDNLEGDLEDNMISYFADDKENAKELTITGLYKPSTGGKAKILLTDIYGNGLNYTVTVEEQVPPPITLAELLNTTTKTITYKSNLEFADNGTMVDVVNDPDFRGGDEDEDEYYFAVAYKITLHEDDNIEIHSSKEGYSCLFIYKSDGELMDGDGCASYYEKHDSYLSFTAEEDGDYYIVVSDFDKNRGGRYFLTVWTTEEEPENEYPTTPIIAKVPKANTNTLKAAVQNGTLHLSGLTAGKTWSIYTVSGALVQNGIASGTEANLRLNTSGVYLVKSNGQAIRVINR